MKLAITITDATISAHPEGAPRNPLHSLHRATANVLLECSLPLEPLDGGHVHGCAVRRKDRLHFDSDLVDRPGECCRHLVFLAHRGREILTDIRAFVGGECERLGSSDPAFGKLGATQRNPPNSARSRPAAVVGEVEAKNLLTRRHRIAGGNFVTLDTEPVVGKSWPTVLKPKAPPAEASSLCQDHARCAGSGYLHLGRDRE